MQGLRVLGKTFFSNDFHAATSTSYQSSAFLTDDDIIRLLEQNG